MRVDCDLHNVCIILVLLIVFSDSVEPLRHYSKKDIRKFREEVREMFQHAYQGYLTYASGYDELRPLSCDGVDTWGSYSLTLIDALDTLAVMGNYSEFKRVVGILTEKIDFDRDINVSVFETNIRIVGGLLSAHLMSRKAGLELEPGWPCNGPLLRLAEDVAKRLLPAFDTNTGMPYGTVNLRHGVPPGETPITCTAGVGTFIVEFGALSRLTGDPIYEEVALNALYALWKYRSPIGLFGNHIDVQTGRWTAQDAGIGAGVDSYFEYLVKGALMLNRPDLLEMFHEARKAIDKYMKRDDWYVWVSMNKGQVTLPVFQSLEAYWPGVLSMIGESNTAKRIFLNYHSIWKQYGFLPEFYNIPNGEAVANRESYPLRPELIEAAMYLYRATDDPVFLEAGVDILYSIQYSARTPCGYATIKNVRTHQKEDRMESFFLAETTKYLYLLFDPENYMHNDGHEGVEFETPNGMCVIEAGGYIFNTEAHPIDPAALRCCHDLPQDDMFKDFRIEDYYGDAMKFASDEDKEEFGCPEKEWRKDVEDMIIDIESAIDPSIPSGQKISADLFKTEHYSGSGDSADVKMNQKKYSAVWKQLEKLLDQIPTENTGNELMNLLEQDGTEIVDLIRFLMKNIKVKSLSNKLFDLMETSEGSENTDGYKPILKVFEENERLKLIFEVLDEIVQNENNENNKTDMNDAVRSMARILSVKNQDEVQNLNKSDSSVLEIMRKAQLRYEYITSHPIRMLVFLLETHGLGSMDRKVVKKILEHTRSIDLMKSFTYPDKLATVEIQPEYFEQVQAIMLAIAVIDENRWHSKVKEQPKTEEHGKLSDPKAEGATTEEKDQDPNSGDTASNDDIIVIDNKIHTDEDIGVGTVEAVDLKNFGDSLVTEGSGSESADRSRKSDASQHIKPTTTIHSQPPAVDEGSESLISDLVQTVLKSAFPPKPKFEAQLLLEKIRAKGEYMNYSKKYELLTCKAQPFLQRFSRWGQVY